MLRNLKEKLFLIYIFTFAILAVFPLFHIIFTVYMNGLIVITKGGIDFILQTLPPPGEEIGGIFPAIFGTFVLVFLSSLMGIPVAVLAGIFIAEYPNSIISRTTKTLLMILLEFPTILVGLFVMSILVIPMGKFSAIAGAVALAVVMLPYVASYTEQAMRSVPEQYREAGYALGLSRVRVVFSITMKIAKKGVITGLLIGMAKVTGETAPLIFTAGNVWRSIGGIDEPIGAIPLWIYYLVQQPYANYHELAWGASAILLTIFLSIFIPLRLMIREVRI